MNDVECKQKFLACVELLTLIFSAVVNLSSCTKGFLSALKARLVDDFMAGVSTKTPENNAKRVRAVRALLLPSVVCVFLL